MFLCSIFESREYKRNIIGALNLLSTCEIERTAFSEYSLYKAELTGFFV